MLGSRIIFAGPIKVFTKVNKDRQRESNHVVYSLYNPDILGDSIDCRVEGGVRIGSKRKMKTSPLTGPSKDKVSVGCSDKAINLPENTSVISSVVWAELARVQAKLEFDLEVQKIEYQGNTNTLDSAGFKLKEGSRTKLLKSLDLTFLVKIFCMLISLYFSTSGAEDFWTIIERKWEELRSKIPTWSKIGEILIKYLWLFRSLGINPG